MLEEGRISDRQAVYLIITSILPTSILFLPHMIYKGARQDAWLSVILITFFGLAAGEVIGRLARRFPAQTIVEYSRELVGPYLGGAIGLLYAGFFLYINSFVVRELAEMLTTNFYEETPIVVFVIATVFVVVYIVRHGLEVLGRVNDIVLPLILAMLGALVLFIIPTLKAQNFFPVLENGVAPVVRGGFPAAVFFAETFVMLMLTPYLARPDETRPVIAKAVLFLGGLQFLVILAVIGVTGELTANFLFPVLDLARLIRPSLFLTNVDPLILMPWILGGTVKITVFHYCATLAAAQLFRLRNYGVVAVINGIILGVLSLILWEDVVELAEQIARVIPPYFLFIQVGIPLVLLVIAVIGRKGRQENAGQ